MAIMKFIIIFSWITFVFGLHHFKTIKILKDIFRKYRSNFSKKMSNNFRCNSFNNERLRGSHSIVRLFGTLENENVTFIRFLTGTIIVRRSNRYLIKDKVDSMIDCRSKTKKWGKRRKDEMKKISVSLDSLQLQFIYNI